MPTFLSSLDPGVAPSIKGKKIHPIMCSFAPVIYHITSTIILKYLHKIIVYTTIISRGPPSSDKMLIVPVNPVLQLHNWFSHLSLDI